MKQFLRFLALIVASVFPLAGMATNYFISVAGTTVTSDNAKNITNANIIGGRITFDASTNTLTLRNVVMRTSDYGIYVSDKSFNKLHIVLEGNNYFEHVNGQKAALVIYKSRYATDSTEPNCYIEGKGSLLLQDNDIVFANGVSICIGNGTPGGEGYGGPAIYANSMYSKEGSDMAEFRITDGAVFLSGSDEGTLRNFKSLHGFGSYGVLDMGLHTPEGGRYDYNGDCLVDSYGNKVTDEVYIGWKRYGLRVSGVDVNVKNKDKIGELGYLRLYGSVKYDSDKKTLYLNNAECYSNDVRGGKEATIVNTGDELTINATGTCVINNSYSYHGVYTAAAVASCQDVTFTGSGELTLSAVRIEEYEDRTVAFAREGSNDIKFILNGNNGIDLGGGTLYLGHVTLEMADNVKRGIQNMGKLDNRYSEVSTDHVYYDKEENEFYQIGDDGMPLFYEGPVSFTKVGNYYGISVCGVQVGDHNCNNIQAPYIAGGSVSYDARTHALTLNNLDINTQKRKGFSPFEFINAAKTGMKILLKGSNVIHNIDAPGMCFFRPHNASSNTEPHYFFDGGGSLKIDKEGILVEDYCNLCFGSDMEGSQGQGGCTIDAAYLKSYFTAQGRIWFANCMVNLTGGGDFGTVSNFVEVFTSSKCSIITPENGYYDTNNLYLADANGNRVDGEVNIGWKSYGLKICGVEVTDGNKDNIVDYKNSQIAIRKTGTMSNPDYGSLSYDPSTKTLYMKDISLEDYYADNEVPCIENTGNDLRIQCEGNCMITNQNPNDAIYSTKNLEFRGSGNLGISCYQSNGVVMDGDNLSLKFYYCNFDLRKNMNSSSTEFQAINYNSDAGKYGFYVEHSNVTIEGSVHGIAWYELTNAAISTPQVFVQPANDTYPTGCFCKFGEGEYDGETVFTPITTNYNIRVSGHELNDVNCNNFYYDDITSGTVTYDVNSNLLTLDNVTAECTKKEFFNGTMRDYHFNGLNIYSDAKDQVKIELRGDNVFNNINGVGVAIYKNVTFQGDGTLDVGDKSIGCYDGSDIIFDEDCTVNAKQLYGGSDNGGRVFVSRRASLNLIGAGSSYPTVYGLKGFNLVSSISTDISEPYLISPNGGSYDEDQKKLITNSLDGGNVWYGPVQIAPAKWCGLMIGNMYVHTLNCDDIFRDLPHEGTMYYDYESNTLYLEDFKATGNMWRGIGEYQNKDLGDRDFHINLSGENELIGFYSHEFYDNTYIEGRGSLYAPKSNIYPGKSLYINNCTIDGPNSIECTNQDNTITTYCDITRANVHLLGNNSGNPTINGFSSFNTYYAEIITPDPYFIGYTGEIVVKSERISVEDITRLIDEYLEPDSHVTVQDITDLIDRYLEQE